jgi:hypothetical protein
MAPIGAIYALQNEHYAALKDVWYLSKIPLFFIIGFLIASKIRDIEKFLELYVAFSVIESLLFLARFFLFSRPAADENFELSHEAGLANLVTVFVLPLMFRKDVNFIFFKGTLIKSVVVTTMVATIALSYSRAYLFCSILAILSTLGFFRNIRRILLSLSVVVVLGGATFAVLPSSSGGSITFQSKIMNTFTEINFTDASNVVAIIHNWRGFEAFMALREFYNASILEKIFGRGYGATVDLGMYIPMSSTMVYRYLPTLHNGYFYIVGKYGLVGVLLYLVFVFKVLRGTNGWGSSQRDLLADLRVGVALITFFCTLVITGLFNVSGLGATCLFLGALYGYRWSLNQTTNGQCNGLFRLLHLE